MQTASVSTARAARSFDCDLVLERSRHAEEARKRLIKLLRDDQVPVLLCVDEWTHWITVVGVEGNRFLVIDSEQDPVLTIHTWAQLRERSARLLLARIQQLAGDAPVVVTGDFNAHPDGPTHQLLTAQLSDAWEAAPQRSGPEKTAHAFTGTPDARIDWVLFRKFGIRSVHSVDDHEGALYPSDHYPVVAELTWL